MKNVITALVFFTMLASLSFGQSKDTGKNLRGDINTNLENPQQIKNSIKVTINSLKDIDATFSLGDIREIIDRIDVDEDIFFRITCYHNEISNVAYEVKGNTNDIEKFINDVSSIREKAIEFYKGK